LLNKQLKITPSVSSTTYYDEVDEEIVQKIMSYPNLNINKSVEDVRKAISEKRNIDFCGIYELLYHDKLKKKCFEESKEIEAK
jgi:hypothetical protein